jgi:MFS family permease
MLIVGRAVAGLGASGLTNGALTILAAAVPMHKRPRKFFCFSQMGLLTYISAMMGIIMAGKHTPASEIRKYIVF